MMTSVSFICPTTQPGIMFSFLKKKPAPAAVSEFGSLNSGFDKSSGFDENGGGTALGRSAPKPLRHHRALIGQLKHDHAVLVDMYTRIATAGEKGDWRSVEIEIGYFKIKLTDHLLVEAVKLYSYMKKRYESEPEVLEIVKDYAKEMTGIGRVVMAHCATFATISGNLEAQQSFAATWKHVGEVLTERIGREETVLYPIYDNP